ncbi:hypothetical protein ON010_g3544 [Phytophthora cinnamomi]|nr:hypothetical protein ON010_g3544 [Phytophthora cinnamomi]
MVKTRAQRSSPPDDDAKRSSAPIFTPILPLRITSTAHAALVRWGKERREYEDTIHNRETDDLIVPIKNTFDEGLLRQWCRLQWKMSISDVTDDSILTKVDKIISTVKNNGVPDIDQEMAEHLRIDLSERDVHEKYFNLCHDIIDDHGWRIFFTGGDGRKQLCSILIKSLGPKAPREEVDRTARFQTGQAREDEVVLHDLILEKALDHDRGIERPAMRAGSKQPVEKQKLIREASGSGPRPSMKGPVDRPKSPPAPCPQGGYLHWLSECAKLRIERKPPYAGSCGLSVVTKTVTLNDVMELPYCADTGADRIAISQRHVDELMLRDPAIKLTRLSTLLLIFGIAEHEITRSTSVKLRVLLNTAAGPVAIRGPIECLVINDDEPEFILGQDLFKQRHLEKRLRDIETKHDVWRIELGNDTPARVKPLNIRLKDGVNAVKSKPRRYPPVVNENPSSRWASPALPVRKPGTSDDEYRQTCDYRLVNGLIEALISTMPHMSALIEHTKGKKHYGLFDLLKGFWQLPLDEFSQELMSYITDSKIYTPRQLPRRSCDAALHFQQTMEQCLSRFYTKQFFDLVASFELKLSAKKSSLYQQSVRWCGRTINSDGILHDPERIDSLRLMLLPATAGQLQQFLCAANWMRESIADYARAVEPLQRRLDDTLRNSKSTKRVAAGISIELSGVEQDAYDHVKNLLATSATLSLPDDAATTCAFTDASDIGYSVILTQVKAFDPKVPITTQKHQLLTCLSGTFHGSQLNWTIIEKGAYPVVVTCDKLDYLLLRARPFRLFCDHRHVIHVFAPQTSIKKHICGKLLRWALKLMTYRYSIEHVDGTANVWADMLSRWAGQPTTAVV